MGINGWFLILMVWIMDRLTAKVWAPKSDLDPPEIFLITTAFLMPLSAKLLVSSTLSKSMAVIKLFPWFLILVSQPDFGSF